MLNSKHYKNPIVYSTNFLFFGCTIQAIVIRLKKEEIRCFILYGVSQGILGLKRSNKQGFTVFCFFPRENCTWFINRVNSGVTKA